MEKNPIIEGLMEAARHARGDNQRVKVRKVLVEHPLDVKAIRTRMGLTQIMFAQKYGFKLSSIRNWEQRRRHPSGAFQNLLKLIDQIPNDVERVLGDNNKNIAA